MPAAPSEPGAGGRAGRDEAGYADLRSYAAIGDGRTVGLVSLDGRIDWLPLPGVASRPVFAALLDADQGGHISLQPVDAFTVERSYVDDTNVLTTTFRTARGAVRVTDALDTGVAGRLPWTELARRIEGLEGRVAMRSFVRPGTCLNTASPWVHTTASGSVLRADGITMAVRTLGADGVDVGEQDITVHYSTAPGSRHLLALVATEREPVFLPLPEDIDANLCPRASPAARTTTTASPGSETPPTP